MARVEKYYSDANALKETILFNIYVSNVMVHLTQFGTVGMV